MAKNKQLSVWEAACIITGYGIGGGVMSMPYLAARIGFINACIVLIIAFAASYVLHLMIADLSLKTEDGGQIIACLNQFLFKGKLKKVLTFSFFGLMLAILFTNLTGYITGAEEILVSLLPISPFVAKLLFYLLAAAVVIFGLKAVGVSEKISIAVIFGLIGVLAVASFFRPANEIPMFTFDMNGVLAYFGMAMFSLSAFFSVPVDELIRSENAIMLAEKDKREAIRACVARICCAVDILSVTMLFIPLFNADSVPVLMLTGIPLWEKIIFIAIIGVTAFVGVCGLALLHFDKPRGQRCVLYAGMLLSVVGAVIFIAARQSYAAMLYLCFLIVKGFILLKER